MDNKEPLFKSGDIVCLKSGGLPMTISNIIRNYYYGIYYQCVYMNETDNIKEHIIKEDCLRKH